MAVEAGKASGIDEEVTRTAVGDVEGSMVIGSEGEVSGFEEDGVGSVVVTGRDGEVRGLAVVEGDAVETVERKNDRDTEVAVGIGVDWLRGDL